MLLVLDLNRLQVSDACFLFQVVKLKDVFPHGTGFVLVFNFMLSDLSEVIRNHQQHLTPAQVKGYMVMLLKGVAFLHQNNIMHRVSGKRVSYSDAAVVVRVGERLAKRSLSCTWDLGMVEESLDYFCCFTPLHHL